MKAFLSFVLLFTNIIAYAQCGCLGSIVTPDSKLSGKATATYDFSLVRLADNKIISPEVGKVVQFSVKDIPRLPSNSTCTQSIRILISEGSRTLYETSVNGSSEANFEYVFPRNNVEYTVQLANFYTPSHNGLTPGEVAQASRNCSQVMYIKVLPRSKQCDCIAENGINTLVVTGSMTKSNVFDQVNYQPNLQFINKSACSLKIENVSMGKIIASPNLTVPINGEASFANAINGTGKAEPVQQPKGFTSVTVKYSFNGYNPCTQNFTVQYFESKK